MPAPVNGNNKREVLWEADLVAFKFATRFGRFGLLIFALLLAILVLPERQLWGQPKDEARCRQAQCLAAREPQNTSWQQAVECYCSPGIQGGGSLALFKSACFIGLASCIDDAEPKQKGHDGAKDPPACQGDVSDELISDAVRILWAEDLLQLLGDMCHKGGRPSGYRIEAHGDYDSLANKLDRIFPQCWIEKNRADIIGLLKDKIQKLTKEGRFARLNWYIKYVKNHLHETIDNSCRNAILDTLKTLMDDASWREANRDWMNQGICGLERGYGQWETWADNNPALWNDRGGSGESRSSWELQKDEFRKGIERIFESESQLDAATLRVSEDGRRNIEGTHTAPLTKEIRGAAIDAWNNLGIEERRAILQSNGAQDITLSRLRERDTRRYLARHGKAYRKPDPCRYQ